MGNSQPLFTKLNYTCLLDSFNFQLGDQTDFSVNIRALNGSLCLDPGAATTTTTVTSPCSFPCSCNLPVSYVKCFHMKHILVKSVECAVNVPN